MDDNVIPFPSRKPDTPVVSVSLFAAEGTVITAKCDDPMHYFLDRGQPCECGQHWWQNDQAET